MKVACVVLRASNNTAGLIDAATSGGTEGIGMPENHPA